VSDQLIAIMLAWREDLRRARQALDALAVQGEDLSRALREGTAARVIPLPGLVEIDRAHARAPVAIAAALVGYLERGGQLDPAQAADLALALEMMRSRRTPTAGRAPPA
jgi:hypothetical protein